MWHDGIVGRGHAGGRKMSCGMMGLLEKVMPEKEKASDFRGGCPPHKSAGHPGKGKSK